MTIYFYISLYHTLDHAISITETLPQNIHSLNFKTIDKL